MAVAGILDESPEHRQTGPAEDERHDAEVEQRRRSETCSQPSGGGARETAEAPEAVQARQQGPAVGSLDGRPRSR